MRKMKVDKAAGLDDCGVNYLKSGRASVVKG